MATPKDKSRGRSSAARALPGEALAPFEAGAVVIGWIAPGSRPDHITVDFAGNAAGPLPARSTVALDAPALLRAVSERRGAVLAFERGDPARPLLLGLLAPAPSSLLLDSVIDETRRASAERAAAQAAPAGDAAGPSRRRLPLEARLDGKRVVLEARDEIVLRCGEASITLRRDGRLLVKGAYVETRATGVNRIKGGAVKIN